MHILSFPEKKVKLYRPHASKLAKWFTNCNQNNIGSIIHLPKKGDILIISKSYKDCRVLRNQGLNSVWFQSEGMIPNRETLLELSSRFNKIIIWFDNDSTGITSARVLVNHINTISNSNKARSIMIPPILLGQGIKDPSDYIKSKGKEALLEFIKKRIF